MSQESTNDKTTNQEAMPISSEMISVAEKLIGLRFTPGERELMLENVNQNHAQYAKLREVGLDNDVAPALRFDPRLPGFSLGPVVEAKPSPAPHHSLSSPLNGTSLPFIRLLAWPN